MPRKTEGNKFVCEKQGAKGSKKKRQAQQKRLATKQKRRKKTWQATQQGAVGTFFFEYETGRTQPGLGSLSPRLRLLIIKKINRYCNYTSGLSKNIRFLGQSLGLSGRAETPPAHFLVPCPFVQKSLLSVDAVDHLAMPLGRVPSLFATATDWMEGREENLFCDRGKKPGQSMNF
jgi:hypothetical protein